jgi:hypothetical protein
MNFRTLGLGTVCAIILAGCTANQQSIYRHTTVFDDQDVKTTFIASDARARGRTIVKIRTPNGWHVRECRDIPPDVYTLMGASFQGGLSASVKPNPEVSANMANAIQESGRQIQRSQAIAMLNSIQEDHCALWQGGSIDASQYMALSAADLRLVAAVSAIENITSMVEPAQVPSDLSTTAPKPPTQEDVEQASSEVQASQKASDDATKQAKADLNGVKGSNGSTPTCKDIKDKKIESKCEADTAAATSASNALTTAQSKLDALKSQSTSTTDPKQAGASQDSAKGNGDTPTTNKSDSNPSSTQDGIKATTTTIKPVSDAVAIKAIDAIEDIAYKVMDIDGNEIQGFVQAGLGIAGDLRNTDGGPQATITSASNNPPVANVDSVTHVTPTLYIQVSNASDQKNGEQLIQSLRYLFGNRMEIGNTVQVADGGTHGFIRIYRPDDMRTATQLQTIMTGIIGYKIAIDTKYDWMPLPKPGLVELWLGTEDKVPALNDYNLIRKAASTYLIE